MALHLGLRDQSKTWATLATIGIVTTIDPGSVAIDQDRGRRIEEKGAGTLRSITQIHSESVPRGPTTTITTAAGMRQILDASRSIMKIGNLLIVLSISLVDLTWTLIGHRRRQDRLPGIETARWIAAIPTTEDKTRATIHEIQLLRSATDRERSNGRAYYLLKRNPALHTISHRQIHPN